MEGWTNPILGDLCEFRRGLTYKKSDEVSSSSNAVLRANNITVETGEINLDEIRFIRDEIEIPEAKKVVQDCLLVCTASGSKRHLGKVALVEDELDCAFGGFMGLLVPSERTLPKYLFWLTRSYLYADFISGLSCGMNINNLKWSQLSQFAVPLPTLSEQKRIVAILDEAFAAIATATANAEKNLANARELFESELSIAFTQEGNGWVEETIAECMKVRSGDFLPRRSMVESGSIVVYGGNGPTGMHDEANLSGEHVIIGRVGAKCGNVRHVEGDLWLTDNAFFVSEYYREFDLRFLTLVLDRADLRSTANQAAQPVISYKTIKPVILAFPADVRVQTEVVERLSEAQAFSEDLVLRCQRKLTLLTELKQSILHKAFTGELTADFNAADVALSEGEV